MTQHGEKGEEEEKKEKKEREKGRDNCWKRKRRTGHEISGAVPENGMKNSFSLGKPLAFEFGFEVGDIVDGGKRFLAEESGGPDVLESGGPVGEIIGGEMKDSVRFEDAVELRHEIGAHEAVSLVPVFRPGVRTEDVETVNGGIGQENGAEMPGLDAEEAHPGEEIPRRGPADDFPQASEHDVRGQRDPFRMTLGDTESHVSGTASEIEFDFFPGRDFSDVAEKEIFVIEDQDPGIEFGVFHVRMGVISKIGCILCTPGRLLPYLRRKLFSTHEQKICCAR